MFLVNIYSPLQILIFRIADYISNKYHYFIEFNLIYYFIIAKITIFVKILIMQPFFCKLESEISIDL